MRHDVRRFAEPLLTTSRSSGRFSPGSNICTTMTSYIGISSELPNQIPPVRLQTDVSQTREYIVSHARGAVRYRYCRLRHVSYNSSNGGQLLTRFFSAKHLHTPEEQLHSLAGSFGYVAPEVLNKKGHGKAVDIWSTGCVSAHPPAAFPEESQVNRGVAIVESSPTSCSADTPRSARTT